MPLTIFKPSSFSESAAIRDELSVDDTFDQLVVAPCNDRYIRKPASFQDQRIYAQPTDAQSMRIDSALDDYSQIAPTPPKPTRSTSFNGDAMAAVTAVGGWMRAAY